MKKLSKKDIANKWYEDNKEKIDWSIGDNRKKFRETSIWQDFSKKNKKSYCECTFLKGKLTLHHLDEKNYNDLNPKKFKTLGWSIHKIIHQIDRKKDKSNIPEFWLQFCPSTFEKDIKFDTFS